MNALTLVQVAGSAEWAGGERYLELLARHLDRDRFHLEVIAPAAGPLCAALQALDVPVHVVNLSRLVDPKAIWKLAHLLRHLSPQLLQSHGARSNFYARLAGRLARVPVVLSTVHNSLHDYPVSSPRRALYLALDRLTRPLASRVLCVALALAREYGPRAVTIHNGIDLTLFDPVRATPEQTRQTLGLGPGPVIGFIGRHTPQKDPLMFLRVVAALCQELPGVQALVVGDGPLRRELEAEAIRLGLERFCRFTGARHDIPALLGAMDLFILSSVSEGFPFAVLEAMAMERPVVTTAVNGVPELIEDGVSGRVVPPRDEAALTRAALDLLRTPEQAQALGRAARQRVANHFTVARMMRQTQAL
ncbi:MAG: glycosyltransferase, partial [Alphaproteobacteria bacterium]